MVHGFNFKYCSRADFPVKADSYVCAFFCKNCESYYYFAYSDNQFSTLAELAEHAHHTLNTSTPAKLFNDIVIGLSSTENPANLKSKGSFGWS